MSKCNSFNPTGQNCEMITILIQFYSQPQQKYFDKRQKNNLLTRHSEVINSISMTSNSDILPVLKVLSNAILEFLHHLWSKDLSKLTRKHWSLWHNAKYQVCGVRGRGGGEDGAPDHLHHKQLPPALPAHCVWQLLQGPGGGRHQRHPQPVGHCGSGRVREAEDPELPRHWRVHHLLLPGVPEQLGEREGCLGPGAQPPLPPGTTKILRLSPKIFSIDTVKTKYLHTTEVSKFRLCRRPRSLSGAKWISGLTRSSWRR